MFCEDETRGFFDQGNVDVYFKIVAFVAIAKDNLDLYLYLLKNMRWKKGHETREAFAAQSPYIKEFKPEKITHWFLNNHKQYIGMMSNLGIYFLYCIENSSKSCTHKITNSSSFSTNNTDVYDFLSQTKNIDLFNKIMTKHMKIFNPSTSDIIFQKIEQNKRYDMLAYIYEKFVQPKNNIEVDKYIDFLHKNNHANIAHFFKNNYFKDKLEQTLIFQNQIFIKKIKIKIIFFSLILALNS